MNATDETPAEKIGRDNKPVRALAFAGGGFDTVFQIGVIHALLVSRGRAPDVVVGVSQGAVNAVALAEVLQAGESASEERWREWTSEQRRAKLADRVARFRRIYNAARESHDELRAALIPDTYQIDARRPLEALELPIHAQLERDARAETLQSRSGLINLYNELLRVRLSVGSITKGVRRYLGWRAAGEVRPWPARLLVRAGELVRSWLLIGSNLPRLAPLLPTTIVAIFWRRARPETGASAARIIFQSRFWSGIVRGLQYLWAFIVLLLTWLTITTGLIGLVWAIGFPILFGLTSLGMASIDPRAIRAAPLSVVSGIFVIALIYGTARAVPFLSRGLDAARAGRGRWQTISRSFWRAFRDALGTTTNLVLLYLAWVIGLALTLTVLQLVWSPLGLLLEFLIPGDGFSFQLVWQPLALALILLSVPLAAWLFGARAKRIGINLLTRNKIADSLFDCHPVRQLFVRTFDPGYYGDINIDRVVERALRDDRRAQDRERGEKLFAGYSAADRNPPIDVAVAVADVSTGDLEVLPDTTRVVDGLLAAIAVTPLFPPVPFTKAVYIDGANIANEPTRALLAHLRKRVKPEASAVHLYSVAALPFSTQQLEPEDSGEEGREYATLVDVVGRAVKLQQFRDASLERKLTELYTKTMPDTGSAVFPAGKDYLRTWVYPIEPEKPVNLNRRLLSVRTAEDRHRLVSETVADGCRAALEKMIQPAINRVVAAAPPDPSGENDGYAPCREAVANHLREMAAKRGEEMPPDDTGSIPGSNPDGEFGPGLAEVCGHCAVFRNLVDQADAKRHRYSLTARTADDWPEWPEEHQETDMPSRTVTRASSKYRRKTEKMLKEWGGKRYAEDQLLPEAWPEDRVVQGVTVPGGTRPAVSLLFSGGVFRGVYQMGVLNALSEVDLRPDIIAGASVGSITAAMVATAFGAPSVEERRAKIAKLAATYLAVDRLILTDRFADFIRTVTVRAAQTRFSLRDLDRVFRKYDSALPGLYEQEARKVIAGLERLVYISPFELHDLLDAIRRQEYDRVTSLLSRYFQEFLDRGGVRDQILGAEPLALLITEHVLQELQATGTIEPNQVPFDVFLHRSGIYFLATATNLTEGRLEILGEQQLSTHQQSQATLLHGLLASSAFPGVFRPRWSWEVMPDTGHPHQYIDGGVMDNLPLDAVAQFLHQASSADLVHRRPEFEGNAIPHLLFTASLEPELQELNQRERSNLLNNWPRLQSRAKQLRYNQKLEIYERAQQSVRAIARERLKTEPDWPHWNWAPLDLEVVTVKPRWLCGTFAFHPMLGFRRQRQAESIAHGCASTLLRLAKLQDGGETELWAERWGLDLDALPSKEQALEPEPFKPLEPVRKGCCWYRPERDCPFSRKQLEDSGLQSKTIRELNRIYRACGELKTHQAAE